MSKKGALNLGISTIVVLVIAMVLIAGFVSFFRTTLGSGEREIENIIDVVKFEKQPDATNPIVLASGNLDIRQASSSTTQPVISYYNSNSIAQNNVKIKETINCQGVLGEATFKIISLEQDQVLPGSSIAFQTILTHNDLDNIPAPGKYVCNIEIINENNEMIASMSRTLNVMG